MFRWILAISLLATASLALAEATIPTADKKGSKDHPLLKRYEGSFIVAYEQKRFDAFTLPLSKLEPVPERTDSHNNDYHEPKDKRALEGAYTRLVYLTPAERSPLEVLRNYQDELEGKGAKILFECQAGECGGDPGRSSSGGGGNMSLSMYLYPAERITEDGDFSNGYCAMTADISDQRYMAAELPDSGAHVSVLTYTLKDDLYCKAFNGRTIAVVDIVEGKAREAKMVTVAADEIAKAISSAGRIALYGIYFDFNKADVKPESDATLEQISKLLESAPALKLLVVGHTDNVGSLAANQTLSEQRAAAVVTVLTTRFGVAKERLTPLGVSFASPVASNTTEDGRAKNRRVELVDNEPASRP
ncbi:MAG: OmpA family protein [Luteitalea sp.]|nr:OmpA family protein [Luteitalea sp.]